MRMFLSLLAAWLIASLVFALAWVRFADLEASLYVARRVLIEYGILLGLFVFVLGSPVAYLLARFHLVRLWAAIGIASIIGALFGYVLTRAQPDNPFAASFSPWNRNQPGFVGQIPSSAADTWGSLAFCLIIGSAMGAP